MDACEGTSSGYSWRTKTSERGSSKGSGPGVGDIMMMAEWPGVGARRGLVVGYDVREVVGYDVREVKSHLTWGLKVMGRSKMGSHCRL